MSSSFQIELELAEACAKLADIQTVVDNPMAGPITRIKKILDGEPWHDKWFPNDKEKTS